MESLDLLSMMLKLICSILEEIPTGSGLCSLDMAKIKECFLEVKLNHWWMSVKGSSLSFLQLGQSSTLQLVNRLKEEHITIYHG